MLTPRTVSERVLPMPMTQDNKRTPKSKRTPKHAASTQYVSLDVFLDAMTKVRGACHKRPAPLCLCLVRCAVPMRLTHEGCRLPAQSYQAVEDTLLSEWDEVFNEVDEDNNGVLDLEEFVEVRAAPTH